MSANAGQPDLTQFSAKAHPMMLQRFMAGKGDVRDTDFFATLEFSGNGFTFEIREAEKYNQKSSEFDKIKITLPNSEDIRTRGKDGMRGDIRPSSIREIKRQLHFIKGFINDLKHRGNRIAFQAIGTAALRDAANAEDILAAIADEVGDEIEFEIVNGDVEATLSAYGLTMFYPKANGVLVDMGGGSTEFAILKNGQLEDTISLEMGTGSISTADAPRDFVKQTAKALPKRFKKIDTLFLSGGTFRNINKAICAANKWDIKAEIPPEISLSDYKKFVKSLRNMDETSWKLMPENLLSRREFMAQALEVIQRLEKKFPDNAKVALTKTKTRDGLFRLMHDMYEAPENHPDFSVNDAFKVPANER
ncbi:MAG: hypothetical protein AB8B83_05635 [Bdellovibrionales bacterium]